MDFIKKKKLITNNLHEVMGEKHLDRIIKERPLKVYWGTAPTGKPHCGYFVPIIKIAELIKAGCCVTILFADLHAYLDSKKSEWDILDARVEYYERVIKAMLGCFGIDVERSATIGDGGRSVEGMITFIRGSSYQTRSDYVMEVFKLNAITTLEDARRAGAEVVKHAENPLMSSLIYPGLQALDEEYLDVDAQLGGVDQRKIFTMARDFLPRLGYKRPRVHLLNPLMPSMMGEDVKMSASDARSKIDVLDTPKTVRKKVFGAFCEPGNVDNAPLLHFLKLVVFPALNLLSTDDDNSDFVIERDEKFGGTIHFSNYEEARDAFEDQSLHPADLKSGIVDFLNKSLLEHIRPQFESEEAKALIRKAYGK